MNFDESLVEAFERVAAIFPTRFALGSDRWEPTFQQLNDTANRLAYRLIATNVGLGDRAAILMSHDAPMIAGILGILKAGLIVVSINPDDPVSRLKMFVEDAEPSIIVTDGQNYKLAAQISRSGCRIIIFELETLGGPNDNPAIKSLPEQTAFLVYTSGTTDRPKSVMQSHRQILRGAATFSKAMQYTDSDRVPLFASVSTGQGVIGLWPLLNGASVYPFPIKAKGISGLADWMVNRELTVYISSASIFRTLIKTIDEGFVFSNVRAVRLASETVSIDDFRAFRAHFPSTSIFVHGLSSSECSNITWHRWSHSDDVPDGVLPVGQLSKAVSLLDDNGLPVARGEFGEIVVKSKYVANGYWRNPELTSERFSGDLDGNGTRVVRTGDRGRINVAGLLEFCGREDELIKIRGNRIELREIERVLKGLPGIDQTAVIAIRRETHEPILVAFVVKRNSASWTIERLRHALKASLPLHMMPSRIHFLDALPYNRGNKVDKQVLRQYADFTRDDNKNEKRQTETEILVSDIWADALKLPYINLSDDFFSLGENSLSGAVVAAQLYKTLGVELSLGTIADYPTVSKLAAFIDEYVRTAADDLPPIVCASRSASMPLSFFQEEARHSEGTHVRSYRVKGQLNVDVLKECLSYLIDRHEILRTTFGLREKRPTQIIHASGPLGFSFIDLIGVADPEGEADSIILREWSRVIDLEKLPINRKLLIRISSDEYRLIFSSHFVINDGIGAEILDAELASLYEAKLRGQGPPLSRRPPLQYADYAVWQRQVMQLDNPYFGDSIIWWKNLFSSKPPSTKLPFKRLIGRTGFNPNDGVLQWTLGKQVEKQLDELARSVGATHFIVRLAAFAALVADMTENSTVVIGSYIDGRSRVETQNMVGKFKDTIPFVFSYDASKTYLEWLEIVRDRVFETMKHSKLPYSKVREMLWASGLEPPEIQILFRVSSDHSDQNFGNLVISDEFWIVGRMYAGCEFYVDEKKPENCRVNFDANTYDRHKMRVMLDRYLRLLEVAAREPELPIGKLLSMIGAKPLRWTCANYATSIYDFITALYASSPLLKMFWRPIKRWALSGG